MTLERRTIRGCHAGQPGNPAWARNQGRQTYNLGSPRGISPRREEPLGTENPCSIHRSDRVVHTFSLNSYAANSLSQFERARFDKLFNAEGEQHREFCDIFGPEHILENVGEFLNYFMVSKVIVGADTLRASGTVTKKLAKWLVEQECVKSDDADLAIEQGSDAARDLPAAEKLSVILYDLTAGRHAPRDSDVEGRFSITKIEPGRIWLQDDDDGEDYGPILLTEKATRLCRVGWTISGAVRKSGNRCVLVEAFQVYP